MPQKKIDILIPAYHAHSTIKKTLASIAMQTVADQCAVYICNDAGGDDYAEICDIFRPLIDIEELTLPVNGGCGVARQFGIDRSHAPYFICQDADDTFASAFSLDILLKYIESDPKVVMVSAAFVEEVVSDKGETLFKTHANDMIWMHGKLYRREFINKYGIRFNTTRSNEDNGFNTLIRLISSDNEKIMFIPDIVHYWHFKADSITRINNHEYTYNQSFIGYADNMTWAIEQARQKVPFNKSNDIWAIKTMAELYVYYLQTMRDDPRFRQQNFNRCVKYFDEIYFAFADKIPAPIQHNIFSQVLESQAINMKGIVPHVTLQQFIEQMKGGFINANSDQSKSDSAVV